jgi:hypothetical protein
MNQVHTSEIQYLRDMARQGESAAAMVRHLKGRLGSGAHATDLIQCFRDAFFLTLAEVKPLAALTRTAGRDVLDEDQLNRLVMPEIERHRNDWDR